MYHIHMPLEEAIHTVLSGKEHPPSLYLKLEGDHRILVIPLPLSAKQLSMGRIAFSLLGQRVCSWFGGGSRFEQIGLVTKLFLPQERLLVGSWERGQTGATTRLFAVLRAATIDLAPSPGEEVTHPSQWFATMVDAILSPLPPQRAPIQTMPGFGTLVPPPLRPDALQVGTTFPWTTVFATDRPSLLYIYLESHHLLGLVLPRVSPEHRAAFHQHLEVGFTIQNELLLLCLSSPIGVIDAAYHWHLNLVPLGHTMPPAVRREDHPLPCVLVLIESASGGLIQARRDLWPSLPFATALHDALRAQAQTPPLMTGDVLRKAADLNQHFPSAHDLLPHLEVRWSIEPENDR